MSTELTNETKTVEVIRKERTWRIEAFTELDTEYQLMIYREISETQDGEKLPVDRDNVEIPRYQIGVNSILESNDTVTYTDINGIEKTVNVKDLPILITQFCDDEISRAKESKRWNNDE